MDTQTIITLAVIALALLFLGWRLYNSLKRYSCCGTCGCDLMSKKERKAFDERRANTTKLAPKKNNPS